MNWWVFGGVVIGVAAIGYLGQRFGLFDLVGKNKSKSSGNGSGLMGIGDEVFAPARHEAQVELDRQTILPAPAPVAGDPPTGGPSNDPTSQDGGPNYGGHVKIDLTKLPRERD
jgi:hypothetical protein